MTVPISGMTRTFANSQIRYDAIGMDVNAFAQAANSTLINLKANGNAKFSVDLAGTANAQRLEIITLDSNSLIQLKASNTLGSGYRGFDIGVYQSDLITYPYFGFGIWDTLTNDNLFYIDWSNKNTYLSPSGGRVGINTTNPQYTLDVAGTIRANSISVNDSLGLGTLTPGANLEIFSPATSPQSVMYITNANTNSDSFAELEIRSNNAQKQVSIISVANNSAYINTTNQPLVIQTINSNPISLHTNSVLRMAISNTGNVLINRTIDSTVGSETKLDVNGAINASAILVNGVPVLVNLPGSSFSGALSISGTLTATGQIIGPGGSPSSPSFAFTGSQNSGIYLAEANTIGFTTSSNERMRISATGNVGIGTLTPTSLFEVSGNILLASPTVMQVNSPNAFVGSEIILRSINKTLSLTSNVSSNVEVSNQSLIIRTTTSNSIFFQTNNNNTRMVIANTGNILINRTSDSTFGNDTKLDVNGAINASAIFVNGVPVITNIPGSSFSGSLTVNGTLASSGQIIGPAGSVSAPAHTFTGGQNSGIYLASANTMGFSTSSNDRMRISATGNVLINRIVDSTVGFDTRLDVNGAINASAVLVNGVSVITNLPSSAGRLIRAPQILTTGTSYTTPAGCNGIYVECVGGGGKGGTGTQVTSGFNTTVSDGRGGGAGAYCAKFFTVAPLTAYSYTIGAGATLQSAGAGNTTFTVGATTISASGGNYGEIGKGGIAAGGDINVKGSGGGQGGTLEGLGGSSFFGGGGEFASGEGSVGGGGGGGTGTNPSTPGGNGGAGIIRIWEYT